MDDAWIAAGAAWCRRPLLKARPAHLYLATETLETERACHSHNDTFSIELHCVFLILLK